MKGGEVAVVGVSGRKRKRKKERKKEKGRFKK